MNCRQAKRSARFGVSAGLCLVLAVASCAGPQEVKIGALLSETGAAATYGKQLKQGLELALDEINSSGGVLKGRRLVIDYRDDGMNPSKARQAVQDLVDTAKVRAVIGPVASEPALGALEAARQREIVLLSPSASSPQLATEGNGWFFRNFPRNTSPWTNWWWQNRPCVVRFMATRGWCVWSFKCRADRRTPLSPSLVRTPW